jgi:serine/threonine-protein kinase ULK4
MIDGNGTLKLSDFGLAKLEGEDLETIFQETFDTTSTQWTDQAASSSTKSPVAKIYKKPFGEIKALAPEILQGEDNTKESDLWSLGCLLYQMYTGSLPFVSEDLEQLRHMIISKELPNPKGNKLSTKPSSDFLSLIKGLLEKDPCKRFKWKQILKHPFWDQKLKHLLPTKSIIVDGKEKIVDLDDDEENENISNENDDKLNTLAFSTDRPRTAAGLSTIFDQSKQPEVNVSFSISSRLPTSPQSTVHTRNALQYKDSEEPNISSSSTSTITSQQQNDRTEKFDVSSNINMAARNDLKRLFFLANELNTSQIIDNPKIQKPASLKYEPKVLPFTNQKLFKAETFLKLPKDEFEKSLETIRVNTNVPSDKSAGAIKLKLHLMNYIGTICTESSKLADAFVHVDLYRDLILIIKNGHNLEM